MADENGNDNGFMEGINPEDLDPELQKIYKSMQGDYTRKTQELAERRKGFDEKQAQWDEMQRKFGADQRELEQWRAWYKQLEDEAGLEGGDDNDLLGDPSASGDDDGRVTDPAAISSKIVQGLQKKIDSLEGEVQSTNQALHQGQQQVKQMFDYQSQLNKLADEHPGLDRSALLNHAVEKKMTDLEAVYNDLYRDDIINQQVEERLKKELEKIRTVGVKGSPVQHVVRTDGEGTPKNWDDATEQILKGLASEGKLD